MPQAPMSLLAVKHCTTPAFRRYESLSYALRSNLLEHKIGRVTARLYASWTLKLAKEINTNRECLFFHRHGHCSFQ